MCVTITTRTRGAYWNVDCLFTSASGVVVNSLERSPQTRTGRSSLHEALDYAYAHFTERAQRIARPLGGERGQGTVEYVALVLLVALVMFGVVTAMRTYKFSDGQQLGDLIVRKIQEAVNKVRY